MYQWTNDRAGNVKDEDESNEFEDARDVGMLAP